MEIEDCALTDVAVELYNFGQTAAALHGCDVLVALAGATDAEVVTLISQ